MLADSKPQLSLDDKRVINVWNDSITSDNSGHYELKILFKKDNPGLPNNENLALKSLQYLGKRFYMDPNLLR